MTISAEKMPEFLDLVRKYERDENELIRAFWALPDKMPEFLDLVRKYERDESELIRAFWALIARKPEMIWNMSGKKDWYKTSIYLQECTSCNPDRRGVTAEEYALLKNECFNGRKIDAIKLLRGYTGCGLKVARDTVEHWF